MKTKASSGNSRPTTKNGNEDSRSIDHVKLLEALVALKKGDFSVRLPIGSPNLDGRLADAFNDVVELNHRLAQELERISEVVGKHGKITQRASLGDVSGSWKHSVGRLNDL